MKEPQSTPRATDEVAARNISLLRPDKPLIDRLEPVQVRIIREERTLDYRLPYQKCDVTIDVARSRVDSTSILLQRNGYLLLEKIPVGAREVHPSLHMYELDIGDRGEVAWTGNLICPAFPVSVFDSFRMGIG